MLTHFPLAQKDELLTSILARLVHHLGIKDDKVALDILFRNRMVIPSAFLQGHIGELLSQVGHIWHIQPKEIIAQHTHLPLFQSFLPTQRYETLEADLISGHVNPSMSRTGINASLIHWPSSYKICPHCWGNQLELLGYPYWQRLFQSPGLTVCPKHKCRLINTGLTIHSSRRHRFIGAHEHQDVSYLPEAATPYELKLASMVEALLKSKVDYISTVQWTRYYQHLASYVGVMQGARIDHQAIANLVQKRWSIEWLHQQGLDIGRDNTWLLSMFRKHRRAYSYLQHFIVWLSLRDTPINLIEEFSFARTFTTVTTPKKNHVLTKNITKRNATRNKWLNLRQCSTVFSLKQIRGTVIGARLYSWLYRYDRQWLNSHKPEHTANYLNKRVNWISRDLKLAKRLIKINNIAESKLDDPRHSKSWFASTIKCKSLIEKKLHKLPLCNLFFDRYTESIEEYQIRRLTRVMIQLIENKDILRPACEIERLAGLSRKRIRKPAREILRLDIPTWQRIEVFSRRGTTSPNR
jgi:hypothetical protein